MKSCLWLTMASAALALGGSGSPIFAQDSSQMAYTESSGKPAKPAPKKPHKVWTDDDVASVKTAADRYQDQKQAADEAAAASAAAAAKQQSVATSEKKVGAAEALTNPKSPEDADRMIAWEQRDMDAQQEFVEKVRAQLAQSSTPEEREQLQQKLQERLQILEEVKKEHAALLSQKKALQKKAAAGANAEEAAAPPQGQ